MKIILNPANDIPDGKSHPVSFQVIENEMSKVFDVEFFCDSKETYLLVRGWKR